MKKNYFLTIFFIIAYSAKGQVCGTPIPQVDLAPLTSKNSTANGPFCVDIYYHIVRDNNGNGGINPSQLANITENLNEFYNTHEIYFANSGFDYIDNTSFQQISGHAEATYLTQINTSSNAIHYYIVESLWNTSRGYITGVAIGIPSNKLVIRRDRVLSSTSPHEIGHCLNLYHTFETHFGVENIVRPPNPNANCTIAGDFLCDTPADNRTGIGNGYYPDMTNIMSYYSLRNHFTNGQGTRMRIAIANEPILSHIDSNNCSIPEVRGNESICSIETYTLLNTDPNILTAWSVSDNLQVLSSTNTSITVEQKNFYPNGEGHIEAQVLSDTFRKEVWVGGPKLFTYNDDGSRNYMGTGYSFPLSHSTRTIEVNSESPDITTYTWDMYPTNIQWTSINNKAVFYINTPGNYLLTVEGTDNCGSQLMFFSIQIGGNYNLSIYPNPVVQGSMSVTINSSSSNTFTGGTTNQVKIYDLYGVERFSNNYNSNNFTITGLNFEPGNYILNVTSTDGSVIQEIIVIE